MAIKVRKSFAPVAEQQVFSGSEEEKIRIREVWVKLWSFRKPVYVFLNEVMWILTASRLVRKVAPDLPAEEFQPQLEFHKLTHNLGGRLC